MAMAANNQNAFSAGSEISACRGASVADRRPQQFHRRFPVGVFTTARTPGFTPSG